MHLHYKWNIFMDILLYDVPLNDLNWLAVANRRY